MTFMFRVRFRLPPGEQLNSDQLEIVLREGPLERVVIRPLTPEKVIRDEKLFALRGDSYATATEAERDGERWMSALALGFVAEYLPTDFELRVRTSHMAAEEVERLNSAGDFSYYDDEPGLHVLSEDPPPRFCGLRASGVAGRNEAATIAEIQKVYEAGLVADERVLLALEMYAASENMPEGDADARFLMLMFGVEALIEPLARPIGQLAILDSLRAHLAEISDAQPSDIDAIRGVLSRAREESIGSAGRRLATQLADRDYHGLSAVDFFRKCYGSRSAIVHGSVNRPDPSLIRTLVADLQQFERDLIRLRAGATWPQPSAPAQLAEGT